MTTTKEERIIGRAYNRLLSQLTEDWDEQQACDRHFDGGEWSDAAWAANFEEAQEKAARAVGERFETDWEKVLCIAEYDMPTEELDCYLKHSSIDTV